MDAKKKAVKPNASMLRHTILKNDYVAFINFSAFLLAQLLLSFQMCIFFSFELSY